VRTRIATVLGLGLAACGLATAPAAPADAATPITVYASPSGGGSACTSSAPCSLAGARALVETIDQNMSANINVDLYGGVYRL